MSSMVYLVAFMNGFIMMSFEMVGTKILSPFFGNGMNTWGSVISVFMIFLAIGAWLGGRISRTYKNLNILIFMLLGLMISILGVLNFSQCILNTLSSASNQNDINLILSSIALFSPFALLSGAIAPYSIQLLSNDKNSGQVAGKLYFISTLACGIGTLCTSFYLVVFLSIQNILILNITLIVSTIITLLLVLIKKSHFQISFLKDHKKASLIK